MRTPAENTLHVIAFTKALVNRDNLAGEALMPADMAEAIEMLTTACGLLVVGTGGDIKTLDALAAVALQTDQP